jgi:hypothetical protein
MEKSKIKIATFILTLLTFSALILYAFGIINLPKFDTENEFTADGIVVSGDFTDGRFHGSGQMKFENESFFTGTLQSGRLFGHGTFTSSDGWRFEGTFLDGNIINKSFL